MRTCSQSWLFSRSLALAAATCAATSSRLERSADASSPTCSSQQQGLGPDMHEHLLMTLAGTFWGIVISQSFLLERSANASFPTCSSQPRK